MAAPTIATATTGATDAGGAWSYTINIGPTNAGRIIIAHVLQDGATSGAVAVTGSANVNNLAGTAGWTYIGEFAVGASSEAIQHLWIGRTILGESTPTTISGTNSTSEDLYIRYVIFNNGSIGTTLDTVIENVTAGATVNSTGTSATAADASVTTLGADRLALNFIAVNDDNAIALFTGMSGGTWNNIWSYYAEASGTDGSIGVQSAPMATAGTISGGTGSITDSDAWGVVGFALIGTTGAYRAYAQTQAAIKVTSAVYAQALAVVDGLRFASDTFTRTVSPGLGTADVGGSWQTTSDSTFSTTGSQAQFTSATTPDQNAWLPATCIGPTQVQVKFSINQLSTGFIRPGIIVRRDQSTTVSAVGQFKAYIRIGATGASTYRFNAGGVEISNAAGATFSAGTQYYMKLQVHNTSANIVAYRFRVWEVGTAEPSTWAVDTTYNTTKPDVLAPGTVGLNGQSDTSPIVISYDDFLAQTYIPAGFGQAQADIKQVYRVYAQAQASVSGYSSLILGETGLIGYWRLGEPSGTTLIDSSSNGLDGTYTGTVLLGQTALIDDSDTAARFQGSAEYGEVPHDTLLNLGDGPLTLEIWAQRHGDSTAAEFLLGKGAGAFLIYIDNAERVKFGKVDEGDICEDSTTLTGDTTRHHFVVTKNGSSVFLYRDAVDVTTNLTNRTLINNSVALGIADNTGPLSGYDITLDEVAIYNVVLSSEQVSEHYAMGSGAALEASYVHAQAQSKIKQIYYVHAQAQADVKQTYYAHAQTQANVKQIYRVYAQAQSNVKQTYYVHAQAQATIKRTYHVHAQAQGTILAVSYGLGQAQADIKQTYYAHGQALAYIVSTVYVHGQAQALIYIPQHLHPMEDIAINGWVGVVI